MHTEPITQATRAVVYRFYELLAGRRLEAVAGLFADNIDWYIPGEQALAPWLGRRLYRSEVQTFFELLLAGIESLSFEIEHVLAEGRFAVVTGHFASRMLQTGMVYESIFSAHFTVENDVIVRYRFLEDSHALVKALQVGAGVAGSWPGES